MEATSETPGAAIKRRRVALGLSVRDLAKRAKVDRGTVDKAEADQGSVRETTYGRIVATLNSLEDESGMDTPDMVTSTITLPDGSRIVFAGTSEGVAEAAARYMRERSTS